MRNRILFVSSTGGHFIQLLRVVDSISKNSLDVAIAAPYKSYSGSEHSFKYFAITDFSRDNVLRSSKLILELVRIKKNFNPSVVISTGAAPGLLSCLFFKIIGRKVIWIDSIANSESISLSGRIASIFCDHTLTQWPALSSNRIKYKGRVL